MQSNHTAALKNYFSLALVPDKLSDSEFLIDLARSNCLQFADGYLLGECALPHITLCQFQSDMEDISAIWSLILKSTYLSETGSEKSLEANFSTFESISVAFRYLYLKPGTKSFIGKYWFGVAVKPSPLIIALQKTLYGKLAENGILSRNKPSVYFPHLTFACCAIDSELLIPQLPSPELWTTDYSFCLTLGQSDENGRFRKKLFP